ASRPCWVMRSAMGPASASRRQASTIGADLFQQPGADELIHGPCGAGSRGASRARNSYTTALFAYECQSFLDNVIARLGQTGSWNNPHSPAGLTSTAKLNREYECLVRFDSITRVSSPDPRRVVHLGQFVQGLVAAVM